MTLVERLTRILVTGLAALALVSALRAPVAQAQAQAQDAARVRVLFGEGLDLADRGDWATGAARFEAALAIRDTPPIRFNLARCLERLGRLVEAAAHLVALEHGGPAAPSARNAAQRLRADIEPRIGRIVVRVRGITDGDVVRVDRRTFTSTEIAQPVAIDPGTRHVALMRGERVLDELDVVVSEGGVSHVVLSATAVTATAVAAAATPDVDAATHHAPALTIVDPTPRTPEEPSVFETWWLWTIVGAVVAGAVITVAVLMLGSDDLTPSRQGDFGPGVLVIGR